MQVSNSKMPVAILGATGTVGQRFVQLLSNHPWFKITTLTGSSRSQGKTYRMACDWRHSSPLPQAIQDLVIQPVTPNLDAKLVFSALPTGVAKKHEPELAKAGFVVCSNSSAFRKQEDVPLVIPEINADHFRLISSQKTAQDWKGFIVTSPNCTTTGIVMALKPLADKFGIEKVFAVSMQAISGAGYPGISALDISGNIFPYIPGEEEKIEEETRILLGTISQGKKHAHELSISSQANRVDVLEGHTASISIQLKKKSSLENVYEAYQDFQVDEDIKNLPSSPNNLFILHKTPGRPQPRIDRDAESGMAVSVGQIRPCSIFDLKMTTVIHNTIRGAAGGALLNAELLVSRKLIPSDE
ncbi:MAG: aspartate-semialdehyde dehydrogenase [Chloroflexi bacterium]|nr:aspartate-semialdehyde dehydrogenase [Chloroflexota bacterium]